VAATAAKFDLGVRAVQSSHEGVRIDAVHEARLGCCGIVINPGGFAHTSVALADALAAVALPVAEVHLTNVYRREPYRHHSYVSAIADVVIAGAGPLGYDAAVRYLAATATGGDAVAPPA
jgi:3-dehydroquinate dehydratase-2